MRVPRRFARAQPYSAGRGPLRACAVRPRRDVARRDARDPGRAGGRRGAAGGRRRGRLRHERPVHSRDEQVRRLTAEGFHCSADEFVTAGRAAAMLAFDELGAAPVIALGSQAFRDECVLAGLTLVPGPDGAAAVLLGGSRDITFADLTTATRAVLMHGATVYASSADATFPAPGGPVPGAGAVRRGAALRDRRAREDGGQAEPCDVRGGALGARAGALPRRRRPARLRHRRVRRPAWRRPSC